MQAEHSHGAQPEDRDRCDDNAERRPWGPAKRRRRLRGGVWRELDAAEPPPPPPSSVPCSSTTTPPFGRLRREVDALAAQISDGGRITALLARQAALAVEAVARQSPRWCDVSVSVVGSAGSGLATASSDADLSVQVGYEGSSTLSSEGQRGAASIEEADADADATALVMDPTSSRKHEQKTVKRLAAALRCVLPTDCCPPLA
jgi:hypothetical protein